MSSTAFALQFEILNWRDAQMEAVSRQLEDAFPTLEVALAKAADEAGWSDLARNLLGPRKTLEPILREWRRQQAEIAFGRAEAGFDAMIAELPDDLRVELTLADGAASTWPAIAGAGAITASLAAIPTVISFATVPTTLLGIAVGTTVSAPVLFVGVAGLSVAGILGWKGVEAAGGRLRSRFRQRMREAAARDVFGIGAAENGRCLLSDLQAAILKAGETRMQEGPDDAA